VQFGLVVGFHTLQPAGQFLFSGAPGHHLGEAGHVLGKAVQLCAVTAHIGEQLLLAAVEVFGSVQQPAGDFTDGQCWRGKGRWAAPVRRGCRQRLRSPERPERGITCTQRSPAIPDERAIA
jgi:hypothetical protein